MNKKRGLIFVVLLLVFILSFSVSGNDKIKCDNGDEISPNDPYNGNCVVVTSQTIKVNKAEYTIKGDFEIRGTEDEEVVLTFKNEEAISAKDGGSAYKKSKHVSNPGEGGEAEGFAGDGGDGGERRLCNRDACKGGAGAGGGAGGNLLEKGGKGGTGGRVCGDCLSGCDPGGPGGVPGTYAGADIKIKAQNEIKIEYGKIINKGDDGGNGENGGKQNYRGQGGGGGAGGSGGGKVHLEATSVILKNGEIDVSGGDGGKAGNGVTAGVGNDEAGDGGGGGGGAPGIINIYYNSYENQNFKFELKGGVGGETRGGYKDAKKGEDATERSENMIEFNEWAPSDLSGPLIYYCSDEKDNDDDSLFDMQDPDCYRTPKMGGVCYVPLIGDNFFKDLTGDQAGSSNLNDGCCGDDRSKCIAIKPEGEDECENIFEENSCNPENCKWVDSDIGAVINLNELPGGGEGSVRCAKYDEEDWQKEYASNHQFEIKEVEIGDWKIHQISDGEDWFTCDANDKNYLSISENLLENFDTLNTEENFNIKDALICYSAGEKESLIAQCGTDFGDHDFLKETGDSIHSLNTLEGQEIDIIEGSLNIEVLDFSDFSKFTRMYFNLLSDYEIEKIVLKHSSGYKPITDIKTLVNRSNELINLYYVDISNLKKVTEIQFHPKTHPSWVEVSEVRFVYEGDERFCTKYNDKGLWIDDLDTVINNNGEVIGIGKEACNAQRTFGWAGSCCGDDTNYSEDKYEHYLSFDDKAGCYKGIFLEANETLYEKTGYEENKSVLFFTNETGSYFGGCGFNPEFENDSEYNNYYEKDEHNKEFVKPENVGDVCNYTGYHACDISGDWIIYNDTLNCEALGGELNEGVCEYNDLNPNEINFILSESLDGEKRCCPNGGCWDGESCKKLFTFSNDNQFVCLNGEWLDKDEAYKHDPYRKEKGFCADTKRCFINKPSSNLDLDGDGIFDNEDNCLFTSMQVDDIVVSPDGNDKGCATSPSSYTDVKTDPLEEAHEMGICVPTGYYYDYSNDEDGIKIDAYCDEGEWKTRTSLVAAQLLEFVNNSEIDRYTLFCDDKAYSLLDYFTETSNNLVNLNKICVLDYDKDNEEKRIIGFSVYDKENYEHFNKMKEILVSAEISQNKNICDGVITDAVNDGFNQFYECDNAGDDKKVWYNPGTHSLIVTRYNNNMNNPFIISNWPNIFQKLISDPIGLIIDVLKGNEDTSGLFQSENLKILPEYNFDKLYVSKNNGKSIWGFIRHYKPKEDAVENLVSVEYVNVSTHVCDYANMVRAKKDNIPKTIELLCDARIFDESWAFNVISENDEVLFTYSRENLWRSLTSDLRMDDNQGKPDLVVLEMRGYPVVDGEINFTVNALERNLDDANFTWAVYQTEVKQEGWCDVLGKECNITKENLSEWTGGKKFEVNVNITFTNRTFYLTKEFYVNKKPKLQSVEIVPENPTSNDDLKAKYIAIYGVNLDHTYVQFNWSLNGTHHFSGYNKSENGTLIFGNFSYGDNVSVCVTPFDGFVYGDLLCSENVTIGSYCGNKIVEGGEECDGEEYCNNDCTLNKMTCFEEDIYHCSYYYDNQEGCNSVHGCSYSEGSCEGDYYCPAKLTVKAKNMITDKFLNCTIQNVQTQNLSGNTNYTIKGESIDSILSTSLSNCTRYGFNSWEGCDEGSGPVCITSVSSGEEKTVIALYDGGGEGGSSQPQFFFCKLKDPHPECNQDYYCNYIEPGYTSCNYDGTSWTPLGCCGQTYDDGCYGGYPYCVEMNPGNGYDIYCDGVNNTYCSSAENESECNSREGDYCEWDPN